MYVTKSVFCKIFIVRERPNTPILAPLYPFTPAHIRVFSNTLGLLATTFIFKEDHVYASILWFSTVDLYLSFTRKNTIIKQTQLSVLYAWHWAEHCQILVFNFLSNEMHKDLSSCNLWFAEQGSTYPTFLGKDLWNCRNVLYFMMFILRFSPSGYFNKCYLFCIAIQMWISE